MSQPILYACPVCREIYDTVREAEACRDTPMDWCGWKVGDLCIIPGMREWPSGRLGIPIDNGTVKEEWRAYIKPGSDLDDQERKTTWHPYFVITALHTDERRPHHCLVSVVSYLLGVEYSGWNPADGVGHHAMFRPGVPLEQQRSVGDSCWWDEVGQEILQAQPSEALLAQAAKIAAQGKVYRNLL